MSACGGGGGFFPPPHPTPPLGLCAMVGDGCAARRTLPFGSTMLLVGAIGLADGLCGAFASALGANLGARYPGAKDDLARFGAHAGALQGLLRAQAMPSGLEARNGLATPQVRSMCNLIFDNDKPGGHHCSL